MGTANKTRKHTQGGQMLSKITKLIGFGVIIGVNGLCVWGNRIDVIRENLCTIIIEGINLPSELRNAKHPLWNEYSDKIDYVGLKLELPEELIKACKDKHWIIYDKDEQKKLKEIISTEENFHIWCDAQKNQYNLRNLYQTYAYILRKASKKHYFIPSNFCKRADLYNTLVKIYYKDATLCMFILPETPMGAYLGDLKIQIDWFKK